MIGMINIASDSPLEYYAVPARTRHELGLPGASRPTSLPQLVVNTSAKSSQVPLPSPSTKEKMKASLRLFTSRNKTPSTGYCPDGRKCRDGRPVNISAPSQLWGELLMKKMVRRIEKEIKSPVEQLESIDKTFKAMNLHNRDRVMSAPSLVSETKTITSLRVCAACSVAANTIEEEERSCSEEDLSRNSSHQDHPNFQLHLPTPPTPSSVTPTSSNPPPSICSALLVPETLSHGSSAPGSVTGLTQLMQ